MRNSSYSLPTRLVGLSLSLVLLLAVMMLLGLSVGSSDVSIRDALLALTGRAEPGSMAQTIIWQIRLPRVILAAMVGASLGLGGLVFQALLRNPLAEPYILGISGGSAVGAIIGMLIGLSPFPGVAVTAFLGSMAVLAFVLVLAGRQSAMSKDSLLLGGVMMNAFCGALIMFLISLSQSSEMRQIFFWLMGDLSMVVPERLPVLLAVIPAFVVVFVLARPMNLLLLGRETAASMGVNVRGVTMTLLAATSFMVSVVVCQAGLVGFVGLVIPHIFRLILGPDHRLLVVACVLGGAGYLIFCDILARMLSAVGELPVGIITAMIGAPLFIALLWRARQ